MTRIPFLVRDFLRNTTVPAVVLALSACGEAPGGGAGGAPPEGSWSPPVALPSRTAFSMHDHRVVDLRAGPGGTLHALFLDDANGDGLTDRLLHAAFDGTRWHTPVPLDETPGLTEAAQLAVDGASGRVHAVWVEGAALTNDAEPARFTDVLHRVLMDGGWSPAARLYTDPGGGALAQPALAAVGVGGTV
ncbi:MAG TPA: hypothetical protein VHG28_19110, partial [Longimicrobiaceae bacterium]|nr:hypothetical protein [Longimicrobiaceae bacterium]